MSKTLVTAISLLPFLGILQAREQAEADETRPRWLEQKWVVDHH